VLREFINTRRRMEFIKHIPCLVDGKIIKEGISMGDWALSDESHSVGQSGIKVEEIYIVLPIGRRRSGLEYSVPMLGAIKSDPSNSGWLRLTDNGSRLQHGGIKLLVVYG
jgi:hypothetical protein